MPEVTILGLPPSCYVRTVLMTCANKGLSCMLQPVDFRSNDYLQEHPFRKMPVMHHGDVKLYESLAIATYIDEVFDGPALQPKSPAELALMMQWISVTNDYLYKTIVGCCVAERFVKPMRGLAPGCIGCGVGIFRLLLRGSVNTCRSFCGTGHCVFCGNARGRDSIACPHCCPSLVGAYGKHCAVW